MHRGSARLATVEENSRAARANIYSYIKLIYRYRIASRESVVVVGEIRTYKFRDSYILRDRYALLDKRASA